MKLIDVFEAWHGLDKFFVREIEDPKISYAVGKIHKALRSEYKAIDEERKKLLKRFGTEEPEGSGNFNIPQDKLRAYSDTFDNFLNETDTNLVVFKIDKDKLLDSKVKTTPVEHSFLMTIGALEE